MPCPSKLNKIEFKLIMLFFLDLIYHIVSWIFERGVMLLTAFQGLGKGEQIRIVELLKKIFSIVLLMKPEGLVGGFSEQGGTSLGLHGLGEQLSEASMGLSEIEGQAEHPSSLGLTGLKTGLNSALNGIGEHFSGIIAFLANLFSTIFPKLAVIVNFIMGLALNKGSLAGLGGELFPSGLLGQAGASLGLPGEEHSVGFSGRAGTSSEPFGLGGLYPGLGATALSMGHGLNALGGTGLATPMIFPGVKGHFFSKILTILRSLIPIIIQRIGSLFGLALPGIRAPSFGHLGFSGKAGVGLPKFGGQLFSRLKGKKFKGSGGLGLAIAPILPLKGLLIKTVLAKFIGLLLKKVLAKLIVFWKILLKVVVGPKKGALLGLILKKLRGPSILKGHSGLQGGIFGLRGLGRRLLVSLLSKGATGLGRLGLSVGLPGISGLLSGGINGLGGLGLSMGHSGITGEFSEGMNGLGGLGFPKVLPRITGELSGGLHPTSLGLGGSPLLMILNRIKSFFHQILFSLLGAGSGLSIAEGLGLGGLINMISAKAAPLLEIPGLSVIMRILMDMIKHTEGMPVMLRIHHILEGTFHYLNNMGAFSCKPGLKYFFDYLLNLLANISGVNSHGMLGLSNFGGLVNMEVEGGLGESSISQGVNLSGGLGAVSDLGHVLGLRSDF